MAGDLDGKVALITGASSGIGMATARILAEAGMAVALVARRADALERLAGEIAARGSHALALPCDLADDAAADRLVAQTLAWRGRLDLLVNNAGVATRGPLAGATAADLRGLVELNFLALANLTRAALPPLRRAQGHVISVGSVMARSRRADAAAYIATKAAVEAFSESLRRELLPDRVRVTTIHPGVVRTELWDLVPDPREREKFGRMLDAIDPLLAEDVAEAILFVASRPSRVAINEMVIRPTLQEP